MKKGRTQRISRDEIRAVYRKGEEAVIALVEGLLDRIDALEERVSHLESHLNKTSRNSNKPPSSDGFKKYQRASRKKSRRPSGGQKKHPGQTLEWSETVDKVVHHRVTHCQACHQSLSDVPVSHLAVRQVHDIPPLSIQVYEHRGEEKSCPHCGHLNRASFPPEVCAPIQYGSQLKGLVTYLMSAQLLPSQRVKEFMAEVYECHLSEGSLYRFRSHCAQQLETFTLQLKTALRDAAVVHFDETGLQVSGKLHWLHIACTKTLTHYFVHPKRGQKAMEAMDILPHFKGVSVHDGWGSYRQYDCDHALCNAHHLRELQAIIEQTPQPWARQMLKLLKQIHTTVKRAKKQGQLFLDTSQVNRLMARYQTWIRSGLRQNRPPPLDPNAPKRKGRVKQSPAKNLLDRLKRFQSSVLRFMTDFRVPFDNNQAERDLRMMKLKQKISGTFRSMTGAEEFCQIRGYISTLRKQEIGVLDALTQLFQDNVIIPSLLP